MKCRAPTREFMVFFGLVDTKHSAKSCSFACNEERQLGQRQSHDIVASQKQGATTMCAARRGTLAVNVPVWPCPWYFWSHIKFNDSVRWPGIQFSTTRVMHGVSFLCRSQHSAAVRAISLPAHFEARVDFCVTSGFAWCTVPWLLCLQVSSLTNMLWLGRFCDALLISHGG